MSAAATVRYREIMNEMFKQEKASGALSQDDELGYAERLEACWDEMTDAEHEEIEGYLSVVDLSIKRGRVLHRGVKARLAR